MKQRFSNLLNRPRIIVWLAVFLILIGAARVERAIEKESTLSIISSDRNRWSVMGASLITHGPGAKQTDPRLSDTLLAPQKMHTSGQVMVRAPSGINYVAGRTHTRSSNGKTVQSIVIFKFDDGQHLPSAQTELASDGFDRVSSIAIAANGDVVIAGHTSSDSFPGTRLNKVVVNAYTPHTSKLFIARYSHDLTLLKSSILEGEGHIIPQDSLISSDGIVYLTGSTNSKDFFTTPGAFSNVLSVAEKPLVVDYGADSFIIALDSNLETIVASTLIGGKRRWSNLSGKRFSYVLRKL